ncbi:MAG: hypothetical protein WBX02_18090, partial [Terriglobales bacterium]
LQFLNDKEIAKKEEIASYLEEAGLASSVRWRAARARIEHLLSSAMKTMEKEAAKEPPKANEADKKNEHSQPSDDSRERKLQTTEAKKESVKETEAAKKHSADEKPEAERVAAVAKKDGVNRRSGVQDDENNKTSADTAEKAA